jgi:general secretion pathway protein C
MPNGELKGYRVYPGRDRRKFASLGLRPGDLVTDINGQPLNDLQSGMEVFKNLGNATELTVTIERNGSPMALTLDTSQFLNTPGDTQ